MKMRQRVLIAAYSCLGNAGHPLPGGGDLMAWNVIKRLARFCGLWVLTCEKNREAIEKALAEEAIPGVEFHFAGLPAWMTPLLRFPGSLHLYAYLWQDKAVYQISATWNIQNAIDAKSECLYHPIPRKDPNVSGNVVLGNEVYSPLKKAKNSDGRIQKGLGPSLPARSKSRA
jgi:hypothetical protein